MSALEQVFDFAGWRPAPKPQEFFWEFWRKGESFVVTGRDEEEAWSLIACETYHTRGAFKVYKVTDDFYKINGLEFSLEQFDNHFDCVWREY